MKTFSITKQKLIAKNKISKYLIYSLGEILLVVVGILIAVQINNSNQYKKDRKQEQNVLKQIRFDLNANAQEIKGLIVLLNESKVSMDTVLASMKKRKKARLFPIYVSTVHKKEFFNNSGSGYLLLGSTLGTLIEDDSLRVRVLQLYEKNFENILKRQERMFDFLDNRLSPLSNRLFRIGQDVTYKGGGTDDNSYDLYFVLNFEDFAQNVEYANTVVQLRRMLVLRLNYLTKTQEEVRKTIRTIDEILEGV